MKKTFLLTAYFFIAPTFLALTIIYSLYLSHSKIPLSFFRHKPSVSYAALPDAQNLVRDDITQKDARVEIVKDFFTRYKSVLTPFSQEVVNAADKYGLDYKLIPAIAMQESNLCKKAPKDSYNCWGFGIYGKKVTRFSGYEEAIDTVTKGLASYKNKGLVSPEEIMARYTPSSNGSWADGVNHFISQLE